MESEPTVLYTLTQRGSAPAWFNIRPSCKVHAVAEALEGRTGYPVTKICSPDGTISVARGDLQATMRDLQLTQTAADGSFEAYYILGRLPLRSRHVSLDVHVGTSHVCVRGKSPTPLAKMADTLGRRMMMEPGRIVGFECKEANTRVLLSHEGTTMADLVGDLLQPEADLDDVEARAILAYEEPAASSTG